MSAFQPASYEEARERFKPLRRSQMKRQGDSSFRGSGARQTAGSARDTVRERKKTKRKRLTDGKLKKKVWKEFSLFIRTRGADASGINKCVTCPVRLHFTELHAGHFIRGRLNANLFDERGCASQCYGCNIHRQGNVVIYYKWMLANHGQAVIDELIAQNQVTKKWQAGELQGLLDHYKALNDANPLIERKPKRSLSGLDDRKVVAKIEPAQ